MKEQLKLVYNEEQIKLKQVLRVIYTHRLDLLRYKPATQRAVKMFHIHVEECLGSSDSPSVTLILNIDAFFNLAVLLNARDFLVFQARRNLGPLFSGL